MNKAITEGLALMPPAFSEGLDLWSFEDGEPGDGSYLGQSNAAFVPSDQDFGGCMELEKTASTQKLRCFQAIPCQPGLYLQVTIRIKAMSGAFPSVRIAGWAGDTSGNNVTTADQIGPSVALTAYGEVVTLKAIIGSGNRTGVDMVWGLTPVYGHFGLDLTGANGGVVRIEDVVIEDVSSIFHSVMFDWVDVRDYGALGNGVTDDKAAFDAADAAASGKTVIVPPGSYFIGSNLTMDNPVRFEGTLIMGASTRLALTRNYDLPSYSAAFGTELEGFRRALQALFYSVDHVEFSLGGRKVELTDPIDVAALAGLTSFESRRILSDGQLTVVAGAPWTTTSVTAVTTYSTTTPGLLTGVVNVASIPIGSRVSGTGVGREIYVKAVDLALQTVTLSQPLVGGNGTRTLTFTRHRYMLDFSGFDKISRFELVNIEFVMNGNASGVMIGRTGELMRVSSCWFNRPKDKAVTSPGSGCQDLQLDDNEFLSNEGSLLAQDRVSIVFNVNANDAKIRSNRASRFAHFGILAGTGHIILGNHFFGGDDATAGTRRAGLIFTDTNCLSFVTGNYVDNNYIEMTNEYDDTPNFTSELSFGGLTITGNIFVALRAAPWFSWIVVTPRGTGHYVHGLTVTGNVFRAINGNVDRIEQVDETYATLAYTSFRNVIFENNTYNAVDQITASPLMIEHNQASDNATWVVDTGGYLPFGGRARNVMSLVFENTITNSSGTNQYVMPYVLTEMGTTGNQVQLKWPSAVKGRAHVVIRVDNPN